MASKLVKCRSTKDGLILSPTSTDKKTMAVILKKLTVVGKPTPGKPTYAGRTVLKAYKNIGKETYLISRLPVGYACEFTNPDIDLWDSVPTISIPEYSCNLYEYQEVIVDRLLTHEFGADLSPCTQYAYLQLDTGLGKTRIGICVFLRLCMPALVVVPTEEIAHQWLEELKDICPEISCGFYRNIDRIHKEFDFTVIIINTFRTKTNDFITRYGLLILDEAHELLGCHNSNALWLAKTPYVLGLSATPADRPDGLDNYVTKHIGPVLYANKIDGFDIHNISFKGAVRIINYYGDPKCCEGGLNSNGTMSAILTIENIVKDRSRLKLIASEVKRLYTLHENPETWDELGLSPYVLNGEHKIRRHGIFVFAELRELLVVIKQYIIEEFLQHDELPCIYAPELQENDAPVMSMLRGGVNRELVKNARGYGAHIILTTYGFSRRGVSFTDMTSIVLATPRRNGSTQIMGRIFRRGSDETIVRQIVDIVDVRCNLKNQVATRKKVYESKGFPITNLSARCIN